MAEIKIGSSSPKALMFGGIRYPLYNQDWTFDTIIPKDNKNVYNRVDGQWQINDGWIVEILSPKKIAIKQFKIDTWGLRFITGEGAASNQFNNRHFKVSGISWVNENVVQFQKAYGGSVGFNVYWYPGQFDKGGYVQGLAVQKCVGYTASDQERDDSFQLGRHPWDVYKSCIADGEIQSTWGDGSYRGICIGLYGGEQTAQSWHDESGTAYKIYNIEDHPIIVDLDVQDKSGVYDIGAIECWDAFMGSEQIWHKDKTAQNYWAEYGFLTEVPKKTGSTSPYTHHRVGLDGRKYTVSPITDFEEFMTSHNADNNYVSWTFCKPDNPDFWTPVKEWYKTHKVSMKELLSYDSFGQGLFAHCNCDELELNFTKIKPNEGDQFMYAHQLITGAAIKKLTINVDPDCRVSSLHSFCRASGIEHLIWNGTPPLAHDLSHMFEGCNNVQSIPDCILWDTPLNNPTNLTATFAGCSKLPRIDCKPGMVCKNTYAPIAFNGCSSLVHFEPILDLSDAKPTEYSYHWTWGNCKTLEHLKLMNLKGSWRFDESRFPPEQCPDGETNRSNGHLPALSAECIQYMLEHVQTAPEGETYELYCPSTWAERIQQAWIDGARAKGWNIYIGGVLQ